MKRKDVTYKIQKRWESEDEDEKVEVEFYLVAIDDGLIELRAIVDGDGGEDYYVLRFDQREGIIRAGGFDEGSDNRKCFPINKNGVIRISKETC